MNKRFHDYQNSKRSACQWRRWLPPILLLVFLTRTTGFAPAQEQFNFPAEATKAWSEVQSMFDSKSYSLTSLQVTTFHIGMGENHPEGKVKAKKWVHKATKNMFVRTGIPTDANTFEEDWYGIAECINGEYCFSLGRRKGSTAWYIKSLVKGDAAEKSPVRENASRLRSSLHKLYFVSGWPGTMSEIFESEFCHILNVSPVSEAGKGELVEVHFKIDENAPTNRFPPIRTGVFRFDPSRYWAPVSWEVELAGGSKMTGSNFEWKKCGRIFMPARQTWLILNRDGNLMREIQYTRDFKFETSSKYNFSLSAFGLPEISDNFKRRFPYLTVGLASLAVVALAIGFWIRKRSSK